MRAQFSIYVLFVLVTVFVAASLIFRRLERRWTTRRQWVSFKDWGRAHGFRLSTPEKIASISAIAVLRGQARMALSNDSTTIAQIETAAAPQVTAPAQWNLLVRHGIAAWPDTALRPAHQPASVVDLFSLQSFPLFGSTDRFVVYGIDPAAARQLSKSSVPSLLPPDIGIILKAGDLILDFSARPFDTIECERMLAVADQLMAHLASNQPRFQETSA